MTTTTLVIRPARLADCVGIATVHDAAWRESYRGIIEGKTLEKMISSRGPAWWATNLGRRNAISVLDFAGSIAGYVSFGRSRSRSELYPSQIFELYLKPEYQGLGFGRRLFDAARQSMSEGRPTSVPLIVWALAENERADGFYRHLGGRELGRRSEQIGPDIYETIGYGFR